MCSASLFVDIHFFPLQSLCRNIYLVHFYMEVELILISLVLLSSDLSSIYILSMAKSSLLR